MVMVENFDFSGPQWILDQSGSGPLHWRRQSTENTSRVKFRYEVEVKEFQRGAHELEETEWTQYIENSKSFSTGMTCMLFIAITVILPWYIFIGIN